MQDLTSYDNQVFTFDDNNSSAPNNSPNHEHSDTSPKLQHKKYRDKKKSRPPFQPCCCGGKLHQWGYIVGIYEFITWMGMVALKLLYLLFTNELGDRGIPTNEETPQSLNNQIEIIVFGYGALCGVCMLVATISRNDICCIVHMTMSLLLALAILTLIVLNVILNQRHYKWNLILAYFGFLILQSYISAFSFGLRQLYREESKATSSSTKIHLSGLGRLNHLSHRRHIVPEIVITDHD